MCSSTNIDILGFLVLKVAAMCERERNDIKSTTTNQQSAHGSHYLVYQQCCKTILLPLPLTLVSSRRLLQAAGHAYRHSRQSLVPHDKIRYHFTGFVRDLRLYKLQHITYLLSSRPLTKLPVRTLEGSARALIRSRPLSIKS